MHGIFIVLIVLSIVLYKQRFYADSAYFFFHSINSAWFHIEHSRLLLGFSQLFPIIGYYIGLPLKFLMLSYSMGVELLYYFLFLFLVYKLKDLAAGICLLLIHLIGQLWLFHAPSLEICHGSALAIVFYSILRSGKYKDDKWLIFLLLIEWLVLFSHPANLFLIPFLLAVDYLNRKWQEGIHTSTITVFILALIVRSLSISDYDRGKLQNSKSVIGSDLFTVDYWNDIFSLFVEFYPELIVFLVLTVSYFVFSKKYKKMMFLLGSVVVLTVVISAIDRIKDFGFYAEARLSPIVFLVVFIFLFEVWNQLSSKIKSVALVCFIGVALFRVYWIFDFGQIFTQREKQLDRLVDYTQTIESSKFLIRTENFEKKYSSMTWANPIETLLFSAIDGKNSTRTIISEKDINYQDNSKLINDTSFIFRMFELEPHSFLNERFFKLNKSPYIELNTSKYEVEASEIKDSVSVSFLHAENGLTFQKGDTVLHPVLITNKSGYNIPSAVEAQTFIACHWFNEDGSVYRWDGLRTLFEVDIIDQYSQDIKLAIPEEPGNYFLQADIVIEGKMWFELKDKVNVVVN